MNSYFILIYKFLYQDSSGGLVYQEQPHSCLESWKKEIQLPPTNFLDNDISHLLLGIMLHKHIHYKLPRQRELLLHLLKHKKKYPSNSKYTLLQEVILEHPFLCENTKERCITLFGKINRVYHLLLRFARQFQWKRASCPVTTDLMNFNPIDITKSYNFVLLQNHVKYYFRISDLLRSIERKLVSYDTDDFELLSESPVNPYNKLKLKTVDLYNLYFHILDSPMKVPQFFYRFYLEKFHVETYKVKHETYLKKLAIQNFVFHENAKSERLYKDIRHMLRQNEHTAKLIIHEDFPKEHLVETFRSHLYLDFLIRYGNLECNVEEYYEVLLFTALKSFYKDNPAYGRKKIDIKHPRFPKSNFVFRNNNYQDRIPDSRTLQHSFIFEIKGEHLHSKEL